MAVQGGDCFCLRYLQVMTNAGQCRLMQVNAGQCRVMVQVNAGRVMYFSLCCPVGLTTGLTLHGAKKSRSK